MSGSNKNVFKKCSACGRRWRTREDFLSDSKISLVGYQVHFEELTAGFFFFNHICGTTLAIDVGSFKDLYKGPIFEERKTGSNECPAYCLKKEELRPCPAKCECAYVREVLQIVKHWQKK